MTDLLDRDLDIRDPDQRLAWELRQCHLNLHEDVVADTAMHFEVYRVLWPELADDKTREAEQAFRRATNLSIADYFTIGAALLARLRAQGGHPNPDPLLRPGEYFATVKLPREKWQAFLAVIARDLEVLRDELREEEVTYGPTTYGSLTFERHPLVEIEPGLLLPLSMRSLQRASTQGVFHILRSLAKDEGRDQRTYTDAFGPSFQTFVDRTLRRGVAPGAISSRRRSLPIPSSPTG